MEALTSIGLRPAFFIPLIILAALLLVAAVMVAIGRKWGDDGLNGFRFTAGVLTICAGVAALIAGIMFMPYQWQYAHIYRVSGEVTKVSNVFQDASGAVTGTPILELDTLPVSVETNNQRAVNLEGKHVTLTCTLNWRYASADRVSCDIYEIGEATE